MNKISGVYQIENIITKEIYIGASCDIRRRVCAHRNTLNRECHRNLRLQIDWNIFGGKNFKASTLITCHPDMLHWYEQQFIDQWKPEYNLYLDANGPKGHKFSEDVRAKISASHIGIGHNHSEESKKKISESKKGHIVTEETRKKISEHMKGNHNGANSQGMKGKHHSVESRQKISIANKGRHSIENLGRKRSEKTKAKMSESQKAAWIRRKEETSNIV
jgi:hypothetical protein